MSKLLLTFTIIILSLQVSAATQPILSAKSIFAERITEFVVIRSGNSFVMKMNSNSGEHRERKLSQKDFDFLRTEFNKLPVTKTLPNECSRFQISVNLSELKEKSKTKQSCFGIKTLTEPAYARFAQILVNAT